MQEPVTSDSARESRNGRPSQLGLELHLGQMKRFYSMTIAVALLGGVLLGSWRLTSSAKAQAPPPVSILICGLKDRPCVRYLISFHEPTAAYGDSQGEGVTDYQQKTISIARSRDRYRNIRALQHEVFHAALWERDFHDDSEKWDLHAWIYFTEGVFPLLLHDNPDFVNYVMEE
jgi:hypothetical protein